HSIVFEMILKRARGGELLLACTLHPSADLGGIEAMLVGHVREEGSERRATNLAAEAWEVSVALHEHESLCSLSRWLEGLSAA
ncbi:hypothetical protein PMAYCL1PPCAC_05004, partial [Pristionchus mayeri]